MKDKDKKFYVNVSDLYTIISDIVDGELQVKMVPIIGRWYLWYIQL